MKILKKIILLIIEIQIWQNSQNLIEFTEEKFTRLLYDFAQIYRPNRDEGYTIPSTISCNSCNMIHKGHW
jgi:hypothetical protein